MLIVRDYSVILPLKPREMQRLLSKINREGPNGCWVWTGSAVSGYGRITLRGQTWSVHRLVFEAFVRHVKRREVVDHLCGNGLCCNPEHLQAIVQAINIERWRTARGNVHWRHKITHCRRGHPLSGDNLAWRRGRKGRKYRVCRICENNRKAEDERRRKAVEEAVRFWAEVAAKERARRRIGEKGASRGITAVGNKEELPPGEMPEPMEGSGPQGARRPVP